MRPGRVKLSLGKGTDKHLWSADWCMYLPGVPVGDCGRLTKEDEEVYNSSNPPWQQKP